ncbi:MAG: MGMT family protein [Fimbriimonas sp.]|nr:MGMT family protein [Fimbriimonas sp.]
MAKVDAKRLLAEIGPSFVAELDGEKAVRFNARTMLIPSPADVEAAIRAIPMGSAKTIRQVRAEMAANAGADVTCPFAANRNWRLLAQLAEEDGDATFPWWRVTREHKPNPTLPGGEEAHRNRLKQEGIQI